MIQKLICDDSLQNMNRRERERIAAKRKTELLTIPDELNIGDSLENDIPS
jgi:hypothetical protein